MPLLRNDAIRENPYLRRYPRNADEWAKFIQELNRQQVSAAGLGTAGGSWSTTTVFSATDADTVAWGAGTLTLASGVAYSIGANNTGNMTARTYIYLDIAVSVTEYQTTTTAATAVGQDKVLVAVAEDTTTEAFFQVFGGIGGVLVTANEIAANTITANEIAATTITAAEIAANTITASEIAATTITGSEINATFNLSTKTLTADTGTVGGWTLASTELSSGNVIIDGTDETIKMGSATAPLTGTGVFIGKDSSDYEFRAGDPAGEFIHWDGSALTVSGTIDGTVKFNSQFASIDDNGARIGEVTAPAESFVTSYTTLASFTLRGSGEIAIEVRAEITTETTGPFTGSWRIAIGGVAHGSPTSVAITTTPVTTSVTAIQVDAGETVQIQALNDTSGNGLTLNNIIVMGYVSHIDEI